jgi:excisionase family DNA binding protein
MALDESLLYRLHPDVTSLTHVPRSTTYEHINRGWLRTIRVGRRTYVTREALLAYVARLEAESADRTPPTPSTSLPA